MTTSFPVDLDALLTGGGAPRVALLRYCVMSVTMEPLFVFLVREYRFRPTHAAALALYDVFCAPNGMARVRSATALPPRDLRLSAATAMLRHEQSLLQSPRGEDEPGPRVTTPYRNMFDDLDAALRSDPSGAFATLAQRYDPELEPYENLPGRKMNAGQRQFVDSVWKPVVRPRLVASGFWQLGTIE